MRIAGLPELIGRDLHVLRDLLRADGGDLRVVGGAIRDLVRGEKPSDLDVSYHDPAYRMAEHLETAGFEFENLRSLDWLYRTKTLGMDVDLIGVGRFDGVPTSELWEMDLPSRDFTMNAMAASLEGELHDPCHGYDDAVAGRVRWNGWSLDRIYGDPVRIIRWARFRARFDEPLDAEQLFDDEEPPLGLKTIVGLLRRNSGDRIVREINKLHELQDPDAALAFLDEIGAAKVLGLETLRTHRIELKF
jgi:poly(A) polymerase